jgi:hypothetical protein
MESLVLLVYALPVMGLIASMAAVGCEFVANVLATRREKIDRPPALLIPRKVDLRDARRSMRGCTGMA